MIVTEPDERNRNKRVRCIWDRGSDKSCFKNNSATLVTYILCLSDDFCPIKILSLRFLRIFADESFLPSFAFFSLIAKIRLYYCSRECRYKTVWVFNRDRKFKVGIASRETIRFLTLRQSMVSKIQRSWRQMRDVTFQAGLQTTFQAGL